MEVAEKIIKMINDNLPYQTETEYGEPQIYLDLPNGRYLEITKEQYGLETKDEFYSIRYNCNNSEFENGVYKNSCGIISIWYTEDIETTTFLEAELIKLLKDILENIQK